MAVTCCCFLLIFRWQSAEGYLTSIWLPVAGCTYGIHIKFHLNLQLFLVKCQLATSTHQLILCSVHDWWSAPLWSGVLISCISLPPCDAAFCKVECIQNFKVIIMTDVLWHCRGNWWYFLCGNVAANGISAPCFKCGTRYLSRCSDWPTGCRTREFWVRFPKQVKGVSFFSSPQPQCGTRGSVALLPLG